MDIPILIQGVVAFLAPFLPYLLEAGGEAGKAAASKFGEDAWEKAKSLWGKLHPKIEAKPAAKEAAHDIALAQKSAQEANMPPNDADAQAALRLQLEKLLTTDETLVREIASLMEKGPQSVTTTTIQQKAGDNSIQVGQARDVEIKR